MLECNLQQIPETLPDTVGLHQEAMTTIFNINCRLADSDTMSHWVRLELDRRLELKLIWQWLTLKFKTIWDKIRTRREREHRSGS